MRRTTICHVGLIAAALAVPAVGDVVISLRPIEAAPQPVADGVPAGSKVTVEVLVSADGSDVPLRDVRLLQFDLGATSPSLKLGHFSWLVPARGYGYRSAPQESYAVAGAASLHFDSDPSLIVLTAEPVKVATIEITVDGNGRLSVLGDNREKSRTRVDAGFRPRVTYSHAAGTLRGGAFDFRVRTEMTDPSGTVDTDRDGTGKGDHAERTAPPDLRIKRRRCGTGAVGSIFLSVIFLAWVAGPHRARRTAPRS